MIGGHSLLAMRLLAAIKDRIQVELTARDLFTHPTPVLLALAIDTSEGHAKKYNPLTPLRKEGTKLPIFCFHPGGGLAEAYLNLRNEFPADQPIWGIHAKGLGRDEEPHQTINEMVDVYFDAIQLVQAKGPYQLLGWSLGGLIAQEMAVRLEQHGHKVELLAILDASPEKFEVKNASTEKTPLELLQQQLVNFTNPPIEIIPETMEDCLKVLHSQLVRNNVIIDLTPTDWLKRVIDLMHLSEKQKDDHVIRACEAEILLFRAILDKQYFKPHQYDWGPYTHEGMIEIPIEATHQNICHPESSKNIAKFIMAYLEKKSASSNA
jgi:nonribosomal peptide synthetase DhbF